MARSARVHRDTPKPAAGPRLGEILSSVAVIDLVCAPRSLDVAVSEVAIHDPSSPQPVDAGAIVLGVGVLSDSDDAVELVRGAGEAGAAAVAIMAAGAAPVTLRTAAEMAGVALLSIPDEMTWSQAHSLVRTAISSASGGEDDIAAVPLGDLFALANAVAAMFGGPVTIEDRQSRVLAYSSQSEGIDEPRRQTILGRRVPAEWLSRLEEAGVFKRLWSGEVVRYQAGPGFDLRPRLAVAVRAGDTILGSIWVAEGEEPLGERAEGALREAARIAALHMIRHRASPDLERRSRGELLRAIFESEGSVEATAYGLDVRPDDTFAVLAFEPQSADEVEGALERERALDLVALYGEAFRQRSALVQLGRTIYMLLPGPAVDRPERLIELAQDIIGRARESLGIRLRSGIGSVVSHLRDVPRSREEADQVLRALAASDDGNDVADFESAHGRVVFVELRDFAAERPHLRSRRLAVLASHDRDHGTSYVETLRLFLESFGDIPAAAKRANVHANTFRYRLRRLVDLSGLDVNDPRERLLADLELQLGLED
jgi:DNA-binding PucR family transcriptional regulator